MISTQISRTSHESYISVGCYTGDGRDYRGRASYTSKGSPCINWTGAPEINPSTYPDTVSIRSGNTLCPLMYSVDLAMHC